MKISFAVVESMDVAQMDRAVGSWHHADHGCVCLSGRRGNGGGGGGGGGRAGDGGAGRRKCHIDGGMARGRCNARAAGVCGTHLLSQRQIRHFNCAFYWDDALALATRPTVSSSSLPNEHVAAGVCVRCALCSWRRCRRRLERVWCPSCPPRRSRPSSADSSMILYL